MASRAVEIVRMLVEARADVRAIWPFSSLGLSFRMSRWLHVWFPSA